MSERSIQPGAKLDLGCGREKRGPDYIGVDRLDLPGVDIVGDVLSVLEGIPDETISEVFSSHFLEHVDEIEPILEDIARVLAPDGRFELVVPHFSNPYFYSDPTHRRTFGLYSLSYFLHSPPFKRAVPNYGLVLPLRLTKARLEFRSAPPFYGRYALKRVVESIVNSRRAHQEFYEEMLTYFVPCYQVRYVLVKSLDLRTTSEVFN